MFSGTWGVMPKLSALPAGCLVSVPSPQPSPWPWKCRAFSCQQRWPCARLSVEGFVTLLPQGLSSGNFPILVLFPTWYLAFLCTASSSAGDEGRPRQQELRETEQKHLRVRQSGTRAHSAATSAEGSTGNAHCPCPQGHGHPTPARRGLWAG